MKHIDIKISLNDLYKTDLSIVEYMLLGYLIHYDNQNIELVYMNEDMVSTQQLLPLTEELSKKNYIRIISGVLHVDDKAHKLFVKKYTEGAKEVLDYFNELKAEHLGIKRPTKSSKYLIRIKGLLSEGHELALVKNVFEHCVSTWKDDSFWSKHIDIETICRHFDKYADQYILSKGKKDTNVNRML